MDGILEKFQEQIIADQWPVFVDLQYQQHAHGSIHENIHNDNSLIVIDCIIPKTLLWFNGHYPNQPVLPGVVQVNWVSELAQTFFTVKKFCGVKSLKFKSMILPESSLSISIKYNSKNNAIHFSYYDEHTVFSSGKLLFAH